MQLQHTSKTSHQSFWTTLWISVFLFLTSAILILDQFWQIPIQPLQNMVFLLGSLIFIAFCFQYFAVKHAVYPHSFLKHPICYLSQHLVFERSNQRSFFIMQGYFIAWATLYGILGLILRSYLTYNPYLQVIGAGFYLCVFLVIFMGLIPLDMLRPLHLFITFTLIALHYSLSIMNVAYFFYMRQFGIFISPILLVTSFYYICGTTIYILAYIFQFRASLLQNLWTTGSFIGLTSNIIAFIIIITLL